MMLTSTVILIDEIMNYMYNQDSKSMCHGHNWVFSRGLTRRDASCSLVFFLQHWSRCQWYPLASRSSNSTICPQGEDPKSLFPKILQKSLFSFSLLPFIWESLSRLLLCPLVMMNSQSLLPFACLVVPSISCSHICGNIRLVFDIELIGDVCFQCCTSW